MNDNAVGDGKLSVVVFFRNEQSVVSDCMSSVMREKDVIDQLIIIDDGSNDDSLQVVKSHLDESIPTQIFRHERSLGVNHCLNKGLAAADGLWVHFLAGDDFVLPGFYRRSLALVERHPECGICSAYVQDVNASGVPQAGIRTPAGRNTEGYITPPEAVERLYEVGSWFEGISCIFKRTSLVRIGGFDPQLQGFADALCCWTIAAGEGACFLPEILASKRDVWKGHGFNLYEDSGQAERIWSRAESIMRNQSPQFFSEQVIGRFRRRWVFEQRYKSIVKSYLKECDEGYRLAEIKKYIYTKFIEIYFKPFDVFLSIENRVKSFIRG